MAEAACSAGIRAPRGIRGSGGSLLHELTGDAGPVYVSVATWIDGRPCQLRRDATTAAPWLGQTVATLELIPDPPDAPALDPWLNRWLTEAPTEAQWHAVLDQARRAGRPWAQLLRSRMAHLVSLGTVVAPLTDGHRTLLHTDLQAKNVLVTSTGFALLDWDDSALCSRDRILARTLVEWLTPGAVRADSIKRFMRAYRTHGGSGTIADLTDFGYAVAAALNYLHETLTSDLSDNSAGDDTARPVAALTDVLDLSTLRQVLDLVRAYD